MLARSLREPLVQFLIIGGGLFLAYVLFAPPSEPPRDRIVVDEAVVRHLGAAFEATWKRAPSPDERKGLIDDHIIEEVFYREARKLGLGRNDVVVRRRLRQKLSFLVQGAIDIASVPENDLRAYFEEHVARYATPATLSFRQVYLGRQIALETSEALERVALRSEAATQPDLERLAKSSLLPVAMTAEPTMNIARVFGQGFYEGISQLEAKRWQGPIASSYGWHLVWIDERVPGQQVTFEIVRPQIERDYAEHRRQQAEAALIARLKQQYEIIIQVPQ